MVAGHFGAWEVFAAWTGYNGYPVVPVAVRQKNRGANRFFTELRGDAGTMPIYRKESLANMYQVLADGKLLTLGSDQDARSRGVFVDFFGIQSSTPKGTALFHLKTGAPIVFGACFEQDGEYYLDFEPINVNKEDNVPGEYSDKEIDGANISDKKPEDMNKKELLKCAKELDMKISRKERKDVEVLRQLVIGEFYANAPVESRSGQGPLNVPVEPGTGGVHQGATTPNDQGPDLNDESES